jgi:hypothetical protein
MRALLAVAYAVVGSERRGPVDIALVVNRRLALVTLAREARVSVRAEFKSCTHVFFSMLAAMRSSADEMRPRTSKSAVEAFTVGLPPHLW